MEGEVGKLNDVLMRRLDCSARVRIGKTNPNEVIAE